MERTHPDLQYQVSLLELVSELAHQDNLAVLIALHDLNLAARSGGRASFSGYPLVLPNPNHQSKGDPSA